MQPTPTVFVVDDDDAVRSSLRLLLKSMGYPATAYPSAQSFLDAFTPELPGCLLLDVRMPGLSGPDLQRELNARGWCIPVIFISGHADVPMAVEAMRCGAFDFLQKPFKDQDLLDRVKRALAADCEQRVRMQARRATRDRLNSLTPREREVLEGIAAGHRNKVVAYHLGISQRTVEIHRSRIMEKTSAQSLAQLVRMMATLPARTQEL